MEALLIQFNQAKYERSISSLNSTIEGLNEIIDLYNGMDLGVLTEKDLNALIDNPEDFLSQQIMKDKPATFAGMKINKQKFFEEYIERPPGYYNLIKTVEGFKKQVNIKIERDYPYKNLKSYLKLFDILPDLTFEIKQEVLETTKTNNQVFVTSERAKQAYKISMMLKEMLNDPEAIKCFDFTTQALYDNFMRGILDRTHKEVDMNLDYIKSLDYN